MTFVTRRRLVDEKMDAPDVDEASLRRALRFIRRINRLLGYNRSVAGALATLTRHDPPDATPSVLDVAAGSGDLSAALASADPRLRPVALDFHPRTLGVARETFPDLPLVRGDALRLPLADGSFDYAVCAMFLHHLDDAQAAAVLREIDRVTRRGWVVADLLRRRRALAWITLFTLAADPMVRHDARTSVRQAWRREEVEALARCAGVRATYRETFGHRFVLVREKGLAVS